MIRVAITGNIASGKSQVEHILKEKGYKVFDTDIIAHDILENSQEVLEVFKDYDILENDKVSRVKLGRLVFNNTELLQKLNNIVHPKVKKSIIEIFKEYENETYVFISIPLLYESKMEGLFDKVLFVYCDDNIRLQRLIKRNNFTKEYAKKRISAQLSQDEKINKVDYIIKNETTLEDLKSQIDLLF